MSKILFCDLETTGLSRQHNEIIEIAAVIVDEDTQEIIDSFSEYIKPYKPIPAFISGLTGITNTKVAKCRPIYEVLKDFYEWALSNQVTTVIGHNYLVFDNQFLQAQNDKFGIFGYTEWPIVDTMKLARELKKKNKLNIPNVKQQTLADYFNIEYNPHDAIDDVNCLVKIYFKLKGLM